MRFLIKKYIALQQLDLVALGTVADMMSLNLENRIIVKNGLKLFNWSKKRKCFDILKKELKINRDITSYDLAFIFGPILNSEGRIKGKPEKSIIFLINDNDDSLIKISKYLIKLNNSRKKIVEKKIIEIEKKIEIGKNFFLILEKDVKGIEGLLASKIIEKYGIPTIIVGKDEYGNFKGSGRSIKKLNLKLILDKISKFLINYGGHKMACGIAFKKENLLTIKKLLNIIINKNFKKEDFINEVFIDTEIKIKSINLNLIKSINYLEPYGIGFKKPIFLLKKIIANDIMILKEKHTKFIFNNIEFLFFNKILINKKIYNLIGYPLLNTYKGIKKKQFIILDIVEGIIN